MSSGGHDTYDASREDWPRLVAALEDLYGPLNGRLQAAEEAAREHQYLDRYGPHLHLLQMPNVDFGLMELPAGLGWWMPEDSAIVLDSRLDRAQRRSVLAHLLVHAEQGDPECRATWLLDKPIAKRCSGVAQGVAAARFLPLFGLAASFERDMTITEIARQYRVVEEVVHTRLDTLTARQRTLLALLLDSDELHDSIAQAGDKSRPGRAQVYTRALNEQRRMRNAG